MEELLSKLDKNVFTPEVVAEIQELFEAAVDNKVAEALKLADAHTNEVNEHFESEVKMIKESAEMYKTNLKKRNEKLIHDAITKIKKHYNGIVENIIKEKVDEFVKQGSKNLEKLVESSNKDLIGACEKTADKAGGSKEFIKRMNENAKKEKENRRLEFQNKELQRKLDLANKNRIYESVKNTLSVTGKDMFDELAKNIAYTGNESYRENLESIASKVKIKSNITRSGRSALSESINDKNNNHAKTGYSNFL